MPTQGKYAPQTLDLPATMDSVDDEEWGDFETGREDTTRYKPKNDPSKSGVEAEWGQFTTPELSEKGGSINGDSKEEDEARVLESKIPRLFFEGSKEEIDEAIKWVFEKAFPTTPSGLDDDHHAQQRSLMQAPDLEELVAKSEFR